MNAGGPIIACELACMANWAGPSEARSILKVELLWFTDGLDMSCYQFPKTAQQTTTTG